MSEFTEYTVETAPEGSRELLEGIQSAYGFVPNLFNYMAEAPVAIEAYLKLTELLEKSSLTPAQVQLALLTASLENQCGFCGVAHEAMAKKSGVSPQTITALKEGTQIDDPMDKALADLVRAIVQKRGWVPDETLEAFFQAGFGRQQVFEAILAVSLKTLSNYSNHLTEPEPNPELLQML